MTVDEKPKEIIDGVPDFGKLRDSSEQSGESIPSADQDPHGIGGKARAMHDANIQAQDPEQTPQPEELRGSSATFNFPETINQLVARTPQLHIEIGGVDLSVTHHPSGYIHDATTEKTPLDEWQVSRSAPARTFSLEVAGREIVVSFDRLTPGVTPELSRRALEDIEDKISQFYPHLETDDERATATKFEESLRRIVQKKEAEAEAKREEIKRQHDNRSVRLAVGRNTSGIHGIRISPSITDALGDDVSSVHLIELIRDEPGKPARAVDISKEGIIIDMTDNPARSLVSREHATIEFNGKNQVVITDGSKYGQPSTNGTIVTRS
ncbi:MAG: hypothetical protein QG623_493 [Patescibacteria group bacterium]|nr:hypothetical protein [Patescibacteria group bacterium]